MKLLNAIINLSLASLITGSIAQAQAQAQTQPSTTLWKIKKTAWTAADEKSYSDFVAAIGNAVEKRQCNSFKSCLQHPSNPYRSSDAGQLNIFADCAKLSYTMRAYFAWKNNLPFSYVDGMKLNPVPGNELSTDKRYSKLGNIVRSRYVIKARKDAEGAYQLPEAVSTIKTIASSVNSANFRFHYEDSDNADLFTDFYPVDISRDSIRAGTNIYDPNGHVAVVYKVTADGKIYFIDAHPDNSLTSGLYGTKFVRSNPYQGSGFKNFRSLKLEGSQFNTALDSHIGGKITTAKNTDISDFSLVQFFGTDLTPRPDWKKGSFIFEGQTVDYYEYLRSKLSIGNLILDPMNEVKGLTEDLCQTAQDRTEAVDGALKAKTNLKPHPERLPKNIYGTDGEWEEYSTPSRDARFKTSFKELRDTVEHLYNQYRAGDRKVVYNGTNIKADMLNTYLSVARACKVTYTNSAGTKVNLNLETVRQRLFDLSFDPYHCAELRWGAVGPELGTCKDDQNKLAWYNQEVWLRNQIDRLYDARMDFSLNELNGPKPSAGVATPPDIDLVKFLSQ